MAYGCFEVKWLGAKNENPNISKNIFFSDHVCCFLVCSICAFKMFEMVYRAKKMKSKNFKKCFFLKKMFLFFWYVWYVYSICSRWFKGKNSKKHKKHSYSTKSVDIHACKPNNAYNKISTCIRSQYVTVSFQFIPGIPTISQSVAFPVPCCGSLPWLGASPRCDLSCSLLCPVVCSPLCVPSGGRDVTPWWSPWVGWAPCCVCVCVIVVGCGFCCFCCLCCLCCLCVFFMFVVWKFPIFGLCLLKFFGLFFCCWKFPVGEFPSS